MRTDRRSRSYRRFKTLVAAIQSDIGAKTLTIAQTALVEQAATVLLRAEQVRQKILTGDSVDDDQLVRLSNAARRLLAAVMQLEHRRKKVPLSLAEYLETATC